MYKSPPLFSMENIASTTHCFLNAQTSRLSRLSHQPICVWGSGRGVLASQQHVVQERVHLQWLPLLEDIVLAIHLYVMYADIVVLLYDTHPHARLFKPCPFVVVVVVVVVSKIRVEFDHGLLVITWRADGDVIMQGPATVTFHGVLDQSIFNPL